MTLTQASIQKASIQVVMTSRRWVEPQAMMKSAKPMTNQAQSRAMTRPVRRAEIDQGATDAEVAEEGDRVGDHHGPDEPWG